MINGTAKIKRAGFSIKHIVWFFVLSAIAVAFAQSGSASYKIMNPRLDRVRELGGASPTYQLRSIYLGDWVSGWGASPNYVLHFTPRPPSNFVVAPITITS